MPITYEIDPNSRVLFVQWSSEILPQEVAFHWEALMADPNFQNVSFALTDLREANLVFTGPELWNTFDAYYREALQSKALKLAVLLANDPQEQATRKWMAIAPKTVVTRIFYDREQALGWLKRKQASQKVP